MSYFSKSHTHMPSYPPLTQLWVGQFTSHAKMGVTAWLQKMLGNVVMWNRQSQAFCGVVLQFREHSGSKAGSGFCDYIASRVITWPWGWISDLCCVHPFLSSQNAQELKTYSNICCKKETEEINISIDIGWKLGASCYSMPCVSKHAE